MTVAEDALSALQASGLLDVLIWAAPVAFEATDHLYDEDQGHGQGVVGYLNYNHLTDLMDRATSNGRFELAEGLESRGDDVVKRGVTPHAFNSMPDVPVDAINRNNYKQSPGWAIDGYRVLLQSYVFGKIDDIKWAQRSEAKKRVAAQFYAGEVGLFSLSEAGFDIIPGLQDDDTFRGVTLVAAHAFNPTTKQFEFYVGQSKNPDYPGDSSWYWKKLLISGGTPPRGSELLTNPQLPSSGATADVEDVHIRVKRTGASDGSGAVDG